MDEAQKSGLYARLMAIRPAGKLDREWADAAGVNRSVFTDIRKRGTARYDTIEKLLGAAGLSWAQFDAADAPPALPDEEGRDHVRTTVHEYRAPAASDLISTGAAVGGLGRDLVHDIEVLGTADAAEQAVDEDGHVIAVETMSLLLGDVIERRGRPASWANNRGVYGIYPHGESMVPRFKPGRLIYVDPRRPPAIGDDVVVQLRPTDAASGEDPDQVVRVLLKELGRRGTDYFELIQYNPPHRFRIPRAAVVRMHRVMELDELV